MKPETIFEQLKTSFKESIFAMEENVSPVVIKIDPAKLLEVAKYLLETEGLYFDSLSCITGIHRASDVEELEVVYNLYSIPYHHAIGLRVCLPFSDQEGGVPVVDSVSSIWKTADWHERETYDLFGIHFTGHPDLRRILLPADWEGHPLRKNYESQTYYQNIKVQWEDPNQQP